VFARRLAGAGLIRAFASLLLRSVLAVLWRQAQQW
jgi:hypothetical protein